MIDYRVNANNCIVSADEWECLPNVIFLKFLAFIRIIDSGWWHGCDGFSLCLTDHLKPFDVYTFGIYEVAAVLLLGVSRKQMSSLEIPRTQTIVTKKINQLKIE